MKAARSRSGRSLRRFGGAVASLGCDCPPPSPAPPVASASLLSTADAAPSTRFRAFPQAASCAISTRSASRWSRSASRPAARGCSPTPTRRPWRSPTAGCRRSAGHRAPHWRCPPTRSAVVSCCRSGQGPARAAGRGRRGVPGAARPVRRGRHHPGPARTGRGAVRRRGCAGQRGGHGQGVHQEAARRRGPADRRPRRAAAAAGHASNSRIASGSGCRCSSNPRAAARRSGSAGSRHGTSCPPRSTLARRHDPKVIVEAAMPGRELECGVLEFPDGRVEASTVGEIRVAGVRGREDAFYDFATKYLDDAAELDVPAKIDDDVADEVRQLAIRAFHAIDCQGLARVDFFLTDDGPVVNEINTMPGFTTISMYPRMWAASGVDYPTLLATMVDTALARHRPALAPADGTSRGHDAQTDTAQVRVDAPFRRSRRLARGAGRSAWRATSSRWRRRSPGSASAPIPAAASVRHRPAGPPRTRCCGPDRSSSNHCTASTT